MKRGHYATLTAAVTAYNASCLGGAVIFALTDATYSGSETFPISINVNANASAVNTLTIKPNTGVTSTITGSQNSTALIKLNGADYVTIDGSNSGGTDKSLTITNSGTTSPTAVALISLGTGAGATNNTIKNCNINTGSNAATSYGIAIGGSTPGNSGDDNDNVTVQNNLITKSYIGVFASASATGVNDNLSIKNNTIGSATAGNEVTFKGITSTQSATATINANTITNILTTTAVDPIGIELSTGNTGTTVNGNNISGVNSTNTGGYGGRGIQINTGNATSNILISNNFISDIKGSGWSSITSDAIMGIAIGNVSSTTGGIKLYFNTVNLGSGSFAGNSSGTLSAALAIVSGVTGLDIRNNIFSTNLVNSAATAKSYAVYTTASTNGGFTNINYNDYYVSGTQGVLGALNFTDDATLAAFQTAFGSNTNSVVVAPVFISSTDLHLVTSSNSSLNDVGTTGLGIALDIDGDTRPAAGSTNPDMGADEFLPPANDAGITGLPSTYYCPGSNSVQVTLKNFGSATLTSVTINWSVNGVAQTAYSWSGSLTGNASTTVALTPAYNFIASTNYTVTASTSLPNGSADASSANDSYTSGTFQTGLSGTYTVGVGGNYTTLTACGYSG